MALKTHQPPLMANGQKFRQLQTRLHHVFIYVAQTVNTSNF